MSTFQTVLMGVFVFCIIAGVAFFAISSRNASTEMPLLTVWGSISSTDFDALIARVKQDDSKSINIKYEQKNVDTFDQDLTEALASGVGPDIFLLPQDVILKNQNKVYPIPYTSLPLRTFKTTFIQEGEMYLNDSGVLAVPFSIDPLVMYWNRDLLSNAGISSAPTFWENLLDITPKLTVKDSNLNISKSAVALGEFRNVNNAKEIFSTLVMQAGSPVITLNLGDYRSVLAEMPANNSILPAETAVNFFTQFSNPLKSVYSWNRSLPNSLDRFLSGDLAIYFGFASELFKIQSKNPNLNFDVSLIPQSKNSKSKMTFGKMEGLAISRSSKNIVPAFNTIVVLTGAKPISYLSAITNLPPVRNDLLSILPQDPYMSVFYNSALVSRAWLDPNKTETQGIFQNMVESVMSGRLSPSEAVKSASEELNSILPKKNQ